MDMSNDYWIKKAREYAIAHPSISDVTKLKSEIDGACSFNANFSINLPGKYDIIGETLHGIKKNESVTFVFSSSFPYKSPKIYLRNDFSRNFPHINPSRKKVNPCIYDGDLDELLQQPKWFDSILDQMTDWLEKAASNSLINPIQGWEPMRSDDLDGIIFYQSNDIQKRLLSSSSMITSIVKYRIVSDTFINAMPAGRDATIENKNCTNIYIFVSPLKQTYDKYIPNYINTFEDLNNYASDCKVKDFRKLLDEDSPKLKELNKEILFISIGVRRPYNLINSDYNIEIINFAIKLKFNKKNNTIHLKSQVNFLAHREPSSPSLLQSLSGIDKENEIPIAQVGCGSLGSKICMHLARNGNNNFILIDKNNFQPHNNARHASSYYGLYKNKAILLSESLLSMGIKVKAIPDDIVESINKLDEKCLIIDSCANISVRNFLARIKLNGIVIHTSLYQNGEFAIMIVEGSNRNPRLDDIMVELYSESLDDSELRLKLFTDQAVYLSTGQGCGSFTTIASDARISLSSAGMSSRIQAYLNNDFPDSGELLSGNIDETNMSIAWKNIEQLKTVIISSSSTDDWEWEARILGKVFNEINQISLSAIPNETGGALIGHISTVNRTITISNLLPAPPDSIISPSLFKLGIEGLREKVKKIEKLTNGLLTYVGTWHSHPMGGGASGLDKKTKSKLLILRDYEPTVCLIWTDNRIIRV